MSSENTLWKDYPDMKSCIICDQNTKSHGVLLKYIEKDNSDEEDGEFIAVPNPDDADTLQPVCHTCYQNLDGDAQAVANRYSKKLRRMSNAVGRTLQDFMHEVRTDIEHEQQLTKSDSIDERYESIQEGDILELNGHGPYLIIRSLGETDDAGFFVSSDTPGEEDESYWLHRMNEHIILKEGAPDTPGTEEKISDITLISTAREKVREMNDLS